jgi:hypothetical protein
LDRSLLDDRRDGRPVPAGTRERIWKRAPSASSYGRVNEYYPLPIFGTIDRAMMQLEAAVKF